MTSSQCWPGQTAALTGALTGAFTGAFTDRLRTALLGRDDAPLVLLANFDVEEQWGAGELRLSGDAFSRGHAVVNRMDELVLPLAGPRDCVLLKGSPSPDYLEYLAGLGFAPPRILATRSPDPEQRVTSSALADEALIGRLTDLGTAGYHLLPHGASRLEEELASRSGIPLAAAPAAVCTRVNSKVYSRRIADEIGLRQPRGWACDDLDTLRCAVKRARAILAAGRPVVFKEAYGVSGKGLMVAQGERRLDRALHMISRRAGRAGHDKVSLVVEEWVEKAKDLNYQFTVDRAGGVTFDFVKEAFTEGGVHQGHRIPAGLDRRQEVQVRQAAGMIGERLAADGYFGVVGVDALVDPAGELFPMIEINARSNMSTYQVPLEERFLGPGQIAIAKRYPIHFPGTLKFSHLVAALQDVLYDRSSGTGLVIHNFATVNPVIPGHGAGGAEGPADRRLYTWIVADSRRSLNDINAAVSAILANLAVKGT
jgi:hypothetical protein